ncbi:hypothetical protein [Helicobacter pametensis]|uniref:hypothetical protein n=1 Tax=Helicobacter pametensis TaxID=95149 RepID=UPI0004AF9E3F|nr:hypothetical protein [Helicobacter pametensis]
MISYRAKIKNTLFVGEEYRVSKVIDSKGTRGLKDGSFKVFGVCHLTPKMSLEKKEIGRFLKENQEGVLECLYASGVKITDNVVMRDLQARSKTILAIPPRRVIASLKDGIVELKILEKR